ncbi:MAG: hypothetical protein ACNA8H_07440 [Anaerolineales bacterium]
MKDDRIFTITRWVVAAVIPFLLAAFVILYFFPDNTTDLFAWTISPRMTPLLMGAGYITGAYFFLQTLRSRQWHAVAVGFLPVALFATTMGITTLLHWERFNHNHPSFFAWVFLYATTPFIVFLVWLNNRRTDPLEPDEKEVIIEKGTRRAFSLIGVAVLLLGLLLFLFPQTFLPWWPWQLTPLTARVGGGWFMMPGLFAILLARDRRWSSARLALESLALSLILLLAALPRAWDNFRFDNPFTWVFFAGAILALVGIAVVYIRMEGRRLRSLNQFLYKA